MKTKIRASIQASLPFCLKITCVNHHTPSSEDGKTQVCIGGRLNLEMVLICGSVVREKAMSLEAGK
jgi:hypothetical protein